MSGGSIARLLTLAAACASQAALATPFYVSPDVPTLLGGANRLPWDVVRNDAGTYTTVLSLPAGAAVDGLHRMDGGDWLLSFAFATTLGGTTYQPEDVALHDPSSGSFSLFFDGSAAGIPPGVNVDAVLLDSGDAGDLVVSLDVPATLGAASYFPGDLVRRDASGFSMFFDASSAGIPDSSNVTGAALSGGDTVVSFDVPTTVGGAATYLPGELVAWDGLQLGLFYSDPGWPVSSRVDGLGFPSAPGRVPTITLTKIPIAPNVLEISWSASCLSGATDYGIYEGQIGNWSSHVSIDCTDDGGDRVEQITAAPGNRYYLVVPHHSGDEGSYGLDSNGMERPRGAGVCVATQALAPCP